MINVLCAVYNITYGFMYGVEPVTFASTSHHSLQVSSDAAQLCFQPLNLREQSIMLLLRDCNTAAGSTRANINTETGGAQHKYFSWWLFSRSTWQESVLEPAVLDAFPLIEKNIETELDEWVESKQLIKSSLC